MGLSITELTLDEWADIVPENRIEIFHSADVLRVIDNHTPSELRLFAGYKGQELAGLLPVFVRTFPGVTVFLSPPPGVSMWRMGPVVISNSPKRRKQETLNRTFTEAVLEELDSNDGLTLTYMIFSTAYEDPRPYRWAGYEFEPRFTYRLPLEDTDEETVLGNFTRDLRSEITDLEDEPVSVSVGGEEAALRVYDDYEARFAEQGTTFPTPREYTRDLVATLGDRARVYSAEGPDDEFVGGITVLYSATTAYFWQGGMRANFRGSSVNSLLHWRIIQDILTDPALSSVTEYDLGRAAVERLGEYKSKFGPEVVPYYEGKSSRLLDVAKEAYKLVAY